MVKKEQNRDEIVEQAARDFLEHFFSWHRNLDEEKVVYDIGEEQLEKLRRMTIPKEGQEIGQIVHEMSENILRYGYNVNHSRYFGFIPGPSSMVSWLSDMITAAYNRHAGSWATYPGGALIEQELIRWLGDRAGYPKASSGLFVSGGSMANMTALTVARDRMLTEETWHLGTAYVSEQTHSSVAKGLRIIGIGNSRIRKIPTDDQFRMNVELLKEAIRKDKENGLIPFVVIASAGTTNTGSVDPFAEISAICKENNLWMHVDGAFGASVLLSKNYRQELDGIELSDSISWDAHKWLFQTYACGIVLVKEKRNMIKSFHVHPEYLKDLEMEEEVFNPWDLGMELTRPARGMKLWFTLQVMGTDAVSDALEHGIHLAEWAQEELTRHPAMEIISPAHMAIVNFRYNPARLSEPEKDELNQQISKKMVESGYAGVFTTELNGKKVLRICALHPETTREDVCETVRRLNGYYDELMKSEK